MNMKKNWCLVLAVVFAAALMLSGCSPSDAPAASSATPAEASVPADSSVAAETSAAASPAGGGSEELAAKIEKAKEVPAFVAPADPIDAKTLMTGKKWMTIPVSSSNPFNQVTCEGMVETAKDIGFDITLWENQGDITEWMQGVEGSTSMGVSLVDLFAGPLPESLSAQIENVQGQGVKVVTSSLVDYSQPVDYVDANMGNDYKGAAALLADWCINKMGDDTNALVLVAEDITSTFAMEDAIQAEFETYCPNGKYKMVNVPLSDWATKLQSETENALLADPGVNYIIAIYDSMTQYIVPAVESTGSQAKVVGFNGTPFAVDYVKTGQVEMIVGQSLDWLAKAVVDYEMRVANDLPLPETVNVALRVIDSSNVDETLGADGKAEYSTGYGDSYKDGYAKLWGLA